MKPCALFVALALGATVPALARAEDDKASPTKKDEKPAVDEHSVENAGASAKREAGDLYTRAMAAFDKDDLDTALKGFRDSYARVKSPNSHFMIARTLARKGQNAEAYAELDAVIAEADGLGDRYADTARAAREKREEIRPRVGLLTIQVDHAKKGTKFTVAGEPLAPERLGKPVAVLPGETRVTAIEPGGAEQSFSKAVQAGESATLDIDLASKEGAKPAEEETFHPHYLVEGAISFVGETLDPPGKAPRGAGPSGRLALEISHTGILGNTDSLAIQSGLDWIGTNEFPHYWVPLTFQWNLWVAKDFSVFFEPGIALMFGAGTHGTPVLDVGLRYQIWKKIAVIGRVGIPGATIGASILL